MRVEFIAMKELFRYSFAYIMHAWHRLESEVDGDRAIGRRRERPAGKDRERPYAFLRVS